VVTVAFTPTGTFRYVERHLATVREPAAIG
jgi:hypothetical protein